MVDDRQAVREALYAQGVDLLPGPGGDFLDPWGNRVQIVQYSEIQFSKVPHVLNGMGLEGLQKSAPALQELTAKGMAPE